MIFPKELNVSYSNLPETLGSSSLIDKLVGINDPSCVAMGKIDLDITCNSDHFMSYLLVLGRRHSWLYE